MKDDNAYKKLNRITEIYSILSKRDYTTKLELKSELKAKFGTANDRSVERDLETLRIDFGIPITYKHLKGYCIDDNVYVDNTKINSIMNLLGTTLFRIKHANDSDFIFPEVSITGKGNQYLDDFYYAISKGYKVQINYTGFWDKTFKSRKIKPLLLKEYNQRWYILADKGPVKRVYSLDRIESLRVLTEEKASVEKLNTSFFDNIIGVSEPHLEPQKVVLLFKPLQGLYVKSLKMHKSQNIISDDDNGLMIELKVGLNWELKEQIKKHGNLVKVLEPKHLVDEIRDDLEYNLKQYTTLI